MERDKGKKGKISKKRKKGKKGSKKGKKKKDKDLTPDRTTESLFEELVMNNVIKPYPQVKFNCFYLQGFFVFVFVLSPPDGIYVLGALKGIQRQHLVQGSWDEGKKYEETLGKLTNFPNILKSTAAQKCSKSIFFSQFSTLFVCWADFSILQASGTEPIPGKISWYKNCFQHICLWWLLLNSGENMWTDYIWWWQFVMNNVFFYDNHNLQALETSGDLSPSTAFCHLVSFFAFPILPQGQTFNNLLKLFQRFHFPYYFKIEAITIRQIALSCQNCADNSNWRTLLRNCWMSGFNSKDLSTFSC